VTRVLGIVPPRVDDGRGAHDAGLERHVERGVREAVRAELPTARPQGLDLRMSRRIARGDRAVEAFRDDLVAAHEHRAHRHFAARLRLRGELECPAHEVDVRISWPQLEVSPAAGC